MKAAIIVAHPDDEIIWSGGLILKRPEWDWTVLSLSRADDPDRSRKFRSVCTLLRVKGLISDLDDSDPPKPISGRRDIGRRVVQHLAATAWDLCITHGTNGEYGHPRHKQAHGEVLDLIHDGLLECDELWTFAYQCDPDGKDCRPGPQANVVIRLTEQQLCEKRRIVREEYGYGEDSFEVLACISPEGFFRWEKPYQESGT